MASQNSPSTSFFSFSATSSSVRLHFCSSAVGKISIKTLWIKINLNFRQKRRAVINIRSRKAGFKLGRVAETSDETRLKGINRLLVSGRLGSRPTVFGPTTRKAVFLLPPLFPGINQWSRGPTPTPPPHDGIISQAERF